MRQAQCDRLLTAIHFLLSTQPELFNMTIAENIMYGIRGDVSQEYVIDGVWECQLATNNKSTTFDNKELNTLSWL
jgi:ABC-type multidrug transport system fused ATPase/permease subunit